jgi:hypothetical protein
MKFTDDPDNSSQPTILEEVLFRGHYQGDNGLHVEFTGNGEVSGLGNFKTYSAYVDYADQAMQVDQIGLGSSKDSEKNYGFRFNHDTLRIYKLKCLEFDSINNVCAVLDFGDLEYKLIKKE